MAQSYFKPERIFLKNHPTLNERWVQNLIADDPSILGLGDLGLRDKERTQPRAGRLDLLLQDESGRRYEVEIQLGATDESHIIRTIEYWDIERKRYPQYDHLAVIVAEEITSRFFNVISLFNGSIPLIAIQMQAIKVGEHQTLVFTKVLDEINRGLVDEDEDVIPTDRAYWEKKASKSTLSLVDHLLELFHQFDQSLKLKYNKFYISLEKEGRPFKFAGFRPKKGHINFELRLPQSDSVQQIIDANGLDTLEYNKRWGLYRLRLSAEDVTSKTEVLKELAQMAYGRMEGD